MFLQKHVGDGLGPLGRTACDRIIRACNQRLGAGAVEPELQERLLDLVELATQGYGSVTEPGVQGSSLYLEKIIFHILQKLVTHRAHAAAGRLADFVYLRLQGASSQVRPLTRPREGRCQRRGFVFPILTRVALCISSGGENHKNLPFNTQPERV